MIDPDQRDWREIDWREIANDLLSLVGHEATVRDIDALVPQLTQIYDHGYRSGKAFIKRVVMQAMELF